LAGLQAHAGIDHQVKHVLLISVDGLHALDLTNYVSVHPDSTLAALSRQGLTYTNNSTSTPSDSFPGLASLVTGGSPVTTGLWYDDTYNRALSPPAQTDGLDNPGGNCPGRIGTNVAWDEAIDADLTRLDGGGGLNPKFLVRDPQNGCKTILPHEYVRVNTIFEVVKAGGGRTAWTDKHPSYEWLNGPSGIGLDDFYGPEINSIPVALPQFPGCAPVHFADPTPDDGWTTSFDNIKCYDSLHVRAVINQIDGYNHDRTAKVGVPALFGTNFQAVSVGEKLAVDPVTAIHGGYTDVLGTPSEGLIGELDFVDQSLGQIVAELRSQRLLDSTLIIISADASDGSLDKPICQITLPPSDARLQRKLIRQQAVKFSLDHTVALAYALFQFWSIQYDDFAAVVLNQSSCLQLAGCLGDPLATHAQHVRDQLLRHQEFIAW
jgi:hypothetical protein